MPTYIPDTNVLIDFGRDAAVQRKLERLLANGADFVVSPLAIIELVRGVVANNGTRFATNQKVFKWIYENRFPVLELTLPFAAKILGAEPFRPLGVVPQHYCDLIAMVATAANFDDFIAQTEAPQSVWKGTVNLHQIHEHELDNEVGMALPRWAGAGGKNAVEAFSKMFGAPGCRPSPLIVGRTFSAAFEFLESALAKASAGAKPRKNDPGLYMDFQFLFYLAEPGFTFLTCENFSAEIKISPQRNRIVHPDSL